ncbi:hypothetical protein Q5L94_14215, partial [Idiomarina sp. Sol25]|uniref:hypothetical protein n=1 Tax=Idiomarina sp. Sol25 TaxID=3064000 RepID=UPI00294B7FED
LFVVGKNDDGKVSHGASGQFELKGSIVSDGSIDRGKAKGACYATAYLSSQYALDRFQCRELARGASLGHRVAV